jgi:hypothetical protein
VARQFNAHPEEVQRRVKALAQCPDPQQHRDEAHRRLVRDAVHHPQIALSGLGLIVGEHLGGSIDRLTRRFVGWAISIIDAISWSVSFVSTAIRLSWNR